MKQIILNTALGPIIGFDHVSFPMNCVITCVSWNKAHSAQKHVRVEFKNYEPGVWEVNNHH